MLGCIQPISSPMMNRIFGCEGADGCCALAGSDAQTDTNAVAPRSTAREADPKLVRLDLSQDASSGGTFKMPGEPSLLITSLLIASSFGCLFFQSFFMLMTPILLRLVIDAQTGTGMFASTQREQTEAAPR